MKIKVLLAEDHHLVRRGLALLINSQPDMEVVGEVACGEDCCQAITAVSPDVVVLDLALPDIPGLKVLERLKCLKPMPKVIILTMYEELEFLEEALKLGAKGYLIKRAAEEELIRAVREVARGEYYIHPSLAGKMISRNALAAKCGLSPREMEVLVYWGKGLANEEIAKKLFISVKTVETHKTRIKEKLNLKTRADVVRYCLENNLI
ncbi:response regulator transcription factor [Carboxydothermus ferrireducens]|uniref:Stage 0 sporulation protein A homolog n=1 Tax=Carboxydothermus ferrireducens DSM 11255 TaxID=1119529 RepID=A0ABX2R6S6_9THEO|nr:response regulator transcription factor [Carboxydothermus ferrireducens]NYE56775.1 two-component system response regulator NreC [Carboxydothermus ferrireducens DSM 11255]